MEKKQKLGVMFEKIETPFRPDVRWWLAEGLNTDETLKKNIQEISDLGFGAAEFLAMPEPGADSTVYGWGSDEWTSDTQLIIREATRLGLGFSLTSGAHWASANLPDTYVWGGEPYTPDNKAAAKELDYATVLLASGEHFSGKLPLCPKVESAAGDAHGAKNAYSRFDFQGAAAARILQVREECGQAFGYQEGKGTGKLHFDSLIDLTERVVKKDDGYYLDFTAQEGTWAIFVYWMHGTGQIAAPSVSTNYTINYMDKYGVQALIDYWEEVVLPGEMRDIIRENGRGEIYMDSLELLTYGAGGLFWGYDLKDAFIARKGYDITRYLPVVTADKARFESKGGKDYDYTVEEKDLETVEKIRMDYYSVISELYCENVLKPLSQWLHTLGMKLRAEPSYGANFEISTPAQYVDGIETESFAQTADIDLYRGMLGSANVYDRPFSSETGAVFGRNYYYNMDTWTQLCCQQFAMGINRTVFHGFSGIEGSEADTFWPGHEGMYTKFSERFGARQPASIHYRDWTDALGRCQKMLRQGKPARDLAILRSDYFYPNYGKPKGYDTFERNFMMYDKAYFWQDRALEQAGYTYDYFSPLLLADRARMVCDGKMLLPDGPGYRALVLYQEGLELEAAKALLEIAKTGLPVFFVNHTQETWTHNMPDRVYEKAASKTVYLGDSESELAQIVGAIKALATVYELDAPSQLEPALRKLGITPKAGFTAPNNRIITCARWDDAQKMRYVFAYGYKYDVEKGMPACEFELAIEGLGQPYRIDEWTGEVTQIGLYRVENGKTIVPLALIPGQAALIALDLADAGSVHAVSADMPVLIKDGLFVRMAKDAAQVRLSDGAAHTLCAKLPQAIGLENWKITVEDWDEGEKVVNLEEKFGHVTREVYFTTKKTPIVFENSPLMPWKDLPRAGMEKVSGVGTYETTFVLDASWDGCGAVLEMENAGGGTVRVFVNGVCAKGVHTRLLTCDISDLVKPGENTLKIEVTTTLTNRMLARDYAKTDSRWQEDFPTVQEYGLSGNVTVKPYCDMAL